MFIYSILLEDLWKENCRLHKEVKELVRQEKLTMSKEVAEIVNVDFEKSTVGHNFISLELRMVLHHPLFSCIFTVLVSLIFGSAISVSRMFFSLIKCILPL